MFMSLWRNGHTVCTFNALNDYRDLDMYVLYAYNTYRYAMQFLTTLLTLTIVIGGVAVSGTGVTQRGEVGHHVPGRSTVHR